MLKNIFNKQVGFKRYMSSAPKPCTLNTINTKLSDITVLGGCGFVSIMIYLEYQNQRRFSLLNQKLCELSILTAYRRK
jgi:hypothetical protein